MNFYNPLIYNEVQLIDMKNQLIGKDYEVVGKKDYDVVDNEDFIECIVEKIIEKIIDELNVGYYIQEYKSIYGESGYKIKNYESIYS